MCISSLYRLALYPYLICVSAEEGSLTDGLTGGGTSVGSDTGVQRLPLKIAEGRKAQARIPGRLGVPRRLSEATVGKLGESYDVAERASGARVEEQVNRRGLMKLYITERFTACSAMVGTTLTVK